MARQSDADRRELVRQAEQRERARLAAERRARVLPLPIVQPRRPAFDPFETTRRR